MYVTSPGTGESSNLFVNEVAGISHNLSSDANECDGIGRETINGRETV